MSEALQRPLLAPHRQISRSGRWCSLLTAGAHQGPPNLLQLNLGLDLMRETDPAERHYRHRLEPFVALELALRQGLLHRLLDLALGAHTQRLEKLADADVENVLVHHRLHVAAGCQRLVAHFTPSGLAGRSIGSRAPQI